MNLEYYEQHLYTTQYMYLKTKSYKSRKLAVKCIVEIE